MRGIDHEIIFHGVCTFNRTTNNTIYLHINIILCCIEVLSFMFILSCQVIFISNYHRCIFLLLLYIISFAIKDF